MNRDPSFDPLWETSNGKIPKVRVQMGEFQWEKWDNSKDKIATGEFSKDNLKGTNLRGTSQNGNFSWDESKAKIPVGQFKWDMSKGKIPKGNVEFETFNGRLRTGKFQRVKTSKRNFQCENCQRKCPEGDFEWENSNGKKIPKGNFQWDNSKGTHRRKQACNVGGLSRRR